MKSSSTVDAQRSIEKIVGLIGFLDYCLEHARESPEHSSQWEGLFRVSPNETDFQQWVELTKPIATHTEMRQFLQLQPPTNVIQLSARMLKQLLSKLECPVFPLEFAVELVESEADQTVHDRAVLGSVYADMFLHVVASTVPEKLGPGYCVMAAQLFALLRHVSLEFALTKMDEYNLCVVLLPSVAGMRMDDTTTMEAMMAEAQMLKQFQANHRDGQHCKFEMLVTYGRRIWGVVHALSIDANSLEVDLKEMRQAQDTHPLFQQRKSQVISLFNNAKAGILAARRPHPASRPSLAASHSTAPVSTASMQGKPTLPQIDKLRLSRSESKLLSSPLPPASSSSGGAVVAAARSPAISKAMANSSRRRLSRGDSEDSINSSTSSSPFPPRPTQQQQRQVSSLKPQGSFEAGNSGRNFAARPKAELL
ncbi:hypothetical protein BASA81_003313 [Batrachochytrium salamandrivorans]|nr:hypothetical protein BASA81_003313 [Batrachochytrium salamandrivorans]